MHAVYAESAKSCDEVPTVTADEAEGTPFVASKVLGAIGFF